MKRMGYVLTAAVFCLAGAAFAADVVREAYEAFDAKAAPIHEQLAAKRAEVAALANSESRDDAKVTQLYREMGEFQARLFAARQDLRDALREAGEPGADYGIHHGGGYDSGYGHPGSRYGDGAGYGYLPHGGERRHGGRHMGGGYARHGGGHGW